MTSVVYNKRLVIARCKKCGRIYWHFADEEPFEEFERRLKNHLLFAHVRKGQMTTAEAQEWRNWFDLKWFRVFDPSKLQNPELFDRTHPDFISLPMYEELKMLARVHPPSFIEIARRLYKY